MRTPPSMSICVSSDAVGESSRCWLGFISSVTMSKANKCCDNSGMPLKSSHGGDKPEREREKTREGGRETKGIPTNKQTNKQRGD